MNVEGPTLDTIRYAADRRGWELAQVDSDDPERFTIRHRQRPHVVFFRMLRQGYVVSGHVVVDGRELPFYGRSGDLVVAMLEIMRDDKNVIPRLRRHANKP